MNCKKCAFRDECQYADAVEFCDEYEPSDYAIVKNVNRRRHEQTK